MSRISEKTKFRKNVFVIGSLITAGVCASILIFAESYENKENILTAPLQGDLPTAKITSSSESTQSNKQAESKSSLDSKQSNKQVNDNNAQ
ncbi:hypothetical protein [Fluviispira vulneris]|uniref:hypothetical protein n=1 Tax=Fluviispira vulneris TaxID=2763012 RepID=UPI0016450CFD|nr:hypothetical protein [Fluviispira vulneris]